MIDDHEMADSRGSLRRSLDLGDALVIGIGSMLGAGVYGVWSPAARDGGSSLLIGLIVAALVAFANAMSTARLAIRYPESGGAYVYGRERLGPTWGFVAGWGFVVGKTASCAAMAATIGVYVCPEHHRIVAITAIALITAVNIGGLQRTAAVTRVLLAVSASILLLVVVSGWNSPDLDPGGIWSWPHIGPEQNPPRQIYGVLQSAGLLFFAFAGYARIATLGEEVRDPTRTIPRAISVSLSCVLVVYILLGSTLLATFTSTELSETEDPLRKLVEAGTLSSLAPLVGVGAVISALGALLNLLPGISRTALAMARRRDLPSVLAHVDTVRSIPVRAEITAATMAILIVMLFDLRDAIALSGVGVLAYYAIANASASTLSSRRRDRITAVVGLVGCAVLVVCLPLDVVVTGCALLLSGVVGRFLQRKWGERDPSAA